MSIVTKSIVNADAEARYLSPGELDRIKSLLPLVSVAFASLKH